MNEPIMIITGSAPCVQEDIDALAGLGHYRCDWMAVGLDAVDKYPWPIKYVVTYHPDDLPGIHQRRKAFGGNLDFDVINYDPPRQVSELVKDGVVVLSVPYKSPTGSSALCGALAGIQMGYERIILCGCPLTDAKYIVFQAGWTAKKAELNDRVRSMSGWTRELLGAPTEEWLRG